MALKVGELFASLGMKDGSFYAGLDKAEKAFNGLGNKLATSGAAMTIGLTLPLVKLGKEAFGAAASFESAFAGVKKTVEATDAEYATLERGIIDMSKRLPAAATTISDVAAAAGQLGVATKDVLPFSRVMIDLGESTNLSAIDAATTLARFANITGMSASLYSNLGSVIVGLGNNFATTESEIAAMSLRIAGAGAQVGLTEAQIMGISAALSSVGVEAEAGGSQVSTFLSNMNLAVSNGGKQLKNYAKVAGMTTKDFKKLFKEDAAGAMQAFIEGLGKAEDPIKTLANMGIDEIRMRDALLRLAGGGDLLGRSLSMATDEWEKNTALSEEAQKRYATMESQLSMMKNSVTELARQFGMALAPYVMQVSDLFTGLSTTFQGLSPEVKDTIVKFGALLAALGPGTVILGGLFKTLGKGAGVLKYAFSPLGLIAGGLVLLYKLSPKVRAAFGKMGKFVENFFTALKFGRSPLSAIKTAIYSTFGKETYNSVVGTLDKIGQAWDSAVKWFQNTGEGVQKAWDAGNAEGGFFGGIVESAKYLGSRVGDQLKAGWSAATTAAKALGVNVLTSLGNSLKNNQYFSGFGAELLKAALAIKEGESIDFSGLLRALIDGIRNWKDQVLVKWLQSVNWGSVWQGFWGTMVAVGTWIKDRAVDLGGLASDVWTKIKTWGRTTLLPWVQSIKWGDVWQAFWNAMVKVGEWVGSPVMKLGPLLRTIIANLRNWKDTVLMPWLQAFDWSGLQKTIVDGIFSIKDPAGQAAYDLGGFTAGVVKSLASALGLSFQSNPAGEDVKAKFTAWFSPILGAAYDVGAEIAGQLIAGLLGGFGLKVNPKAIAMALNPADTWKLYSAYIQASATNVLTQAGLGNMPDIKQARDRIAQMYKELKDKYGFEDGFLESFLPDKPVEVPVNANITPNFTPGGGNTSSGGSGTTPSSILDDIVKKAFPNLPLQIPVELTPTPTKTTETPDKPTDNTSGWQTTLGPFSGLRIEGVISDFQFLDGVMDSVNKNVLGLPEGATQAGADTVSNLAAGMSDTSSVDTASGTVGDSALSGIKDKLTTTIMGDVGKNTVQGFANGIIGNISIVTIAATALGLAALAALKKALNIGSPSKKAFKFGAFFGEGFVNGISSMGKAVARVSSGVADVASSKLSYTPVSRPAFAVAGVPAGGAGLDLDRLAAIITSRPALFQINDRVIAKATNDAHSAEEARRQARIRGGYGG